MARIAREFVKLETRLLNDYRFFTMPEFDQLVFVKLLGISRATQNKIPKKIEVIGELLRTKRSATEVKSAIDLIKENFPKFKENKYFYYFEDYELRLNNSAPKSEHNSCVDEDEDLDEDIDKDKDLKAGQKPPALNKPVNKSKPVSKENPLLKTELDKVFKDGFNIFALMNKVKKESKTGAEIPEDVLFKVCARYWQDKAIIKNAWTWFVAVLRREWELFDTESYKHSGMAQSIKSILANVG